MSGLWKRCPAYGKTYYRWNKPNHFGKYYKSTISTNEGSNNINKIVETKECSTSGSEADKSSGDEYVYMNSVNGDETNADVRLKTEGSQIKFQIDRGAM